MYKTLRKILPVLLGIMVVIFAVLYWIFGRQYGVEYQDSLYFPPLRVRRWSTPERRMVKLPPLR